MRKSRMKWLLISTLVLAIALFGCSSGDDESASSDNSEAGTENSGEEVAQDDEMTLTVMRGEHASQPVVQDSPAIQEIYNQTGVKIEIDSAPGSNWDERKSTLIATNSLPDIIRGSHQDIQDYADSGIFLNISEYIDDHAPNLKAIMEENPDLERLKIDGSLYGFPVMGAWRVSSGQFPMIRTDILEELDLGVPTTFDELYEVLKAFKEAYPESYPWTDRDGNIAHQNYLAFALGSGNPIYYEPELDEYVYGPATPEYKDYLAYLNKLYVEELLDPDYAVNTGDNWTEKLSSGRSLFHYDNNGFAPNFNATLQEADPDAKFEMIPILENHKGQKRNYMYNPHWPHETWLVSAEVENPEAVVEFMDWMYSEDGVLVTNFGVLDEHYTLEDGEAILTDSVLEEFSEDQDPFRSMQSALGTGLLAFATHIHDGPNVQILPEDVINWGELIDSQEEDLHIPPLDPPFTEEERDQLTQLRTDVDTLREQEVDKFIMGTRSLDEHDAFIEELRNAGATEIEEIYNAALDRLGE